VYLTDEQWKKIEPLIPKKPVGPKGGRPRADDRLVFEGILWVLKTGARWRDLPSRYPNPSTCWRRLREWYETDVLKDMWRAFPSELDYEGILDWDEVFVDASFFPAKKGNYILDSLFRFSFSIFLRSVRRFLAFSLFGSGR